MIQSDRSVIRVVGHDAKSFLQRLLTNDINELAAGDKNCQYSFLLNVRGKILYDFFIYMLSEQELLLEISKKHEADIINTLLSHKLRAKIKIESTNFTVMCLSKRSNTSNCYSINVQSKQQKSAQHDEMQNYVQNCLAPAHAAEELISEFMLSDEFASAVNISAKAIAVISARDPRHYDFGERFIMPGDCEGALFENIVQNLERLAFKQIESSDHQLNLWQIQLRQLQLEQKHIEQMKVYQMPESACANIGEKSDKDEDFAYGEVVRDAKFRRNASAEYFESDTSAEYKRNSQACAVPPSFSAETIAMHGSVCDSKKFTNVINLKSAADVDAIMADDFSADVDSCALNGNGSEIRAAGRQIVKIMEKFMDNEKVINEKRHFDLMIPKFDSDFCSESMYPFEINLQSGLSQRNKGCYIGQEVVTRIKTQGVIRKQIYKMMIAKNVLLNTVSDGQSSIYVPINTKIYLKSKNNAPVAIGKSMGMYDCDCFLALLKSEFIDKGDMLQQQVIVMTIGLCEVPVVIVRGAVV